MTADKVFAVRSVLLVKVSGLLIFVSNIWNLFKMVHIDIKKNFTKFCSLIRFNELSFHEVTTQR